MATGGQDTLTPGQAMATLACSGRTLRRKAKAGEIQRVMIEGKVHYRLGGQAEMASVASCPDSGQGEVAKVASCPDSGQPNYDIVLRDSYQLARQKIRELETGQEQLKTSRLRWAIVALTAGVTVAILGMIVTLTVGLWRGRAELVQSQAVQLAAIRRVADDSLAQRDAANARAAKAQEDWAELVRDIARDRTSAAGGQDITIPSRHFDI